SAEVVEEGDLIVISGEMFGDMIKANPEIAVRMLRKQSIRLRETNRQLEGLMAGGALPVAAEVSAPVSPTSGTLQAEAKAYFISPSTGNVFPVFSNEALLGRLGPGTGQRPPGAPPKE